MRNLQLPGRSPVHAPTGMASTSHPLSTQTAIDVLKSGGNAMDAAIAACAVQCVVEPGSTGIGGDCFCLYSKGGTDDIIAFNGSGRAPAAASIDWYQDQGISEIKVDTPHAVTVPGAIDAWSQLVGDHGSKGLGELLVPAIDYARNGYPISSRVHTDFIAAEALLRASENGAGIFLPDGKVPAVGDRHFQPLLANTLEAIATHGRDVFYTGEIALDIVEYLQSKGGLHTLEDFAAAQGDYVTPISTEYQGYRVHECPPNGQGVIALLLLNIMSGIERETDNPITVERIHHELEACRMAYRARNIYLADPDHSDVPVEEILSAEFAARIRDNIDASRAVEPAVEVDLPRHEDTVYISVVDKDRNCCSFINTVFTGFGSGLVAPKSGVVLQSRGMGFSLDPDSRNCIAGNKRPLHTIIPGMVTKDARVVMPFGVMGGEYQAFGHMQFLSRFFDYGLDIQQAMDYPRTMVDPYTGGVEVEDGIPEQIRDKLRQRGHRVSAAKRPIGGSQAIWIDWQQGVLTAGSDPRKDGCAIGY